MEAICIKDVIMEFGKVVAFTKGNIYKVEEFNKYENFSTYISVDDEREKHLLGRIDDGWFDEYFKMK